MCFDYHFVDFDHAPLLMKVVFAAAGLLIMLLAATMCSSLAAPR